MGDNQDVSHIAALIYAYGYLGVFSLLMLGIVGLPVPDEWLLSFTGYLIYKGRFHIVPALAAAVLGSICGISVSYWLGHTLGIFFVRRYGHWFHITEGRISGVRAWFERTGRWSLLVVYFIPGIRHLAGFQERRKSDSRSLPFLRTPEHLPGRSPSLPSAIFSVRSGKAPPGRSIGTS